MTSSKRIILRIAGGLFIFFNVYFLFENGNFIKNNLLVVSISKMDNNIEYSINDFIFSKDYSTEKFANDCTNKGGEINVNGNCEFIKNSPNRIHFIGSLISFICTLFIIVNSIKIYTRLNDLSILSRQNLNDIRNIMICLFLIPITKLIFFKSFIPLYATYASLALVIYVYFSSAQKEIELANEEII